MAELSETKKKFNSKEYHKNWYENKKEILKEYNKQRQRDKYEDPEQRAKILERNRNRYRKMRDSFINLPIVN